MKTKLCKAQMPAQTLKIAFLGFTGGEEMSRMFECGAQDEVSESYDLLLVWDYADWEFDYGLLGNYKSVRLFAWSLGVCASALTFSGFGQRIDRAFAFAGTLHPVDDTKGIPFAIYDQTENTLCDKTLRKFLLRICGGLAFARTYPCFSAKFDIGRLKEELREVKRQSELHPKPDFHFDRAFVPTKDRIFPPENQLCAWENATSVEQIPCEHFDFGAMRKIFLEL